MKHAVAQPADPHKMVMSGEVGGNGEDVEKRYFKCSLKRAAGCDAKAQAVSFCRKVLFDSIFLIVMF